MNGGCSTSSRVAAMILMVPLPRIPRLGLGKIQTLASGTRFVISYSSALDVILEGGKHDSHPCSWSHTFHSWDLFVFPCWKDTTSAVPGYGVDTSWLFRNELALLSEGEPPVPAKLLKVRGGSPAGASVLQAQNNYASWLSTITATPESPIPCVTKARVCNKTNRRVSSELLLIQDGWRSF